MIVAHVISRRPNLVTQAVNTARSLADHVVVGLHNIDTGLDNGDVTVVHGSDYIDLTNDVLKTCRALAPSTLRVDDDDWYPPDHTDTVTPFWHPASTVWGMTTIRGCDGKLLQSRHPDMCAGVLPTDIELEGDHLGRVADSLRAQTHPIVVPTQVVKQVCLADTSWIHSPAWARRIHCTHTARVSARNPAAQEVTR